MSYSNFRCVQRQGGLKLDVLRCCVNRSQSKRFLALLVPGDGRRENWTGIRESHFRSGFVRVGAWRRHFAMVLDAALAFWLRTDYWSGLGGR